jgi:hypothetical protein
VIEARVQTKRSALSTSPRWAEQLARFLDDGLQVPGTRWRIGLDPILGLIAPGAGDALSGMANLALLWLAVREGVPASVMVRMVINVVVDLLFGAVPIVGDIFDFAWKATRRNVALIEGHRRGTRPGPAEYVLLAVLILIVLAALLVPILALVAVIVWIGN